MGAIGGLVGGVGSAVGGIEQGQAAQTAANAQAGMTNEQINILNQLLSAYNQGGATQLPGANNAVTGLQGPAGQTGTAVSQLMKAAGSPQGTAAASGTNPQGQLAQLTTALNNTGGTNLAKANPALQSFYGSELQNGLSPQAQQNAQNQLTQQFETAQNNITANARPGQNTVGQQQNAENNLITGSTNLAGNLAATNQQVQQQGAQGLAATASGLDAQTLQMLQDAFTQSNLFGQQTLGNLGTAAGAGSNALATILNYINQGQSQISGVSNELGNIASNYGASAAAAGANAGADFTNASNSLAGLNFNNLFGSNNTSTAPPLTYTLGDSQIGGNDSSGGQINNNGNPLTPFG